MGRAFIAGHVPTEAMTQFKLLVVQRDMTTQDMLVEAMNDLFAKHGLSAPFHNELCGLARPLRRLSFARGWSLRGRPRSRTLARKYGVAGLVLVWLASSWCGRPLLGVAGLFEAGG